MLAGPLLTHTPRVPSLDEVTLARCWQRLGSAIDFLDPDLSLVVRLRHPAVMIGGHLTFTVPPSSLPASQSRGPSQ